MEKQPSRVICEIETLPNEQATNRAAGDSHYTKYFRDAFAAGPLLTRERAHELVCSRSQQGCFM